MLSHVMRMEVLLSLLLKKMGYFIYAFIYKLAFDQGSPPHVQTWFHSVEQELVHLQVKVPPNAQMVSFYSVSSLVYLAI